MVDAGLWITYILVGIAVIASIGLPLYNALRQDPKSLTVVGIGLVALVVLFFVGYGFASDTIKPGWDTEFGVSAGTSKFIGGVLILTYLLMILSIFGIIFGSTLTKLIKK